jgi:hypothetical protein
MYDDDKCDLLLKFLKDELAAQANTFDQIDTKTGVALGFTFIAVGQVLASVFRMATDQNRFTTLHPCAVGGIFVLANACVLIALGCGVKARWPRSFEHSIDWFEMSLSGSVNELKNHACETLVEITKTNDKTNEDKGRWAKRTYAFVGLALFLYIVLTILCTLIRFKNNATSFPLRKETHSRLLSRLRDAGRRPTMRFSKARR